MRVTLIINDIERTFDVALDEYLLDTLRAHNYKSVRRGCDNTTCGACTVLLDGKPVPSCSLLSVRADGHHITTVEGIAQEAERLSEFFGHEGADQCGFCNPSIALNVHAMLLENPNPSDDTIKHYLVGNVCRCTGYEGQLRAIKKYMEDKL